jgi:hypothetical protein
VTLDEAREEIISGIDYAAYRETADKNRLFGSDDKHELSLLLA